MLKKGNFRGDESVLAVDESYEAILLVARAAGRVGNPGGRVIPQGLLMPRGYR